MVSHRKFDRHNPNATVKVDSKIYVVYNISEEGLAFLSGHDSFLPGSKINLELNLEDKFIKTQAVIVHVTKVQCKAENCPFLCGIKFTKTLEIT